VLRAPGQTPVLKQRRVIPHAEARWAVAQLATQQLVAMVIDEVAAHAPQRHGKR